VRGRVRNPWYDFYGDPELALDRMDHMVLERRDATERALLAGAVPPLRFAGAGAQGIVICDSRDRAFKVGRKVSADMNFTRREIEGEYEWLLAAAAHPPTAHMVPKVYALHRELAVLERECVPGEAPDWRDPHMKWYESFLEVPGWKPPEHGRKQWVMAPRGPVMVDAGFALRTGPVLAEHVMAIVRGDKPIHDVAPRHLIWALHAEVHSGRLRPELALEAMVAIRDWAVVHGYPEDRWDENRIEELRAMVNRRRRNPDEPVRRMGRWAYMDPEEQEAWRREVIRRAEHIDSARTLLRLDARGVRELPVEMRWRLLTLLMHEAPEVFNASIYWAQGQSVSPERPDRGGWFHMHNDPLVCPRGHDPDGQLHTICTDCRCVTPFDYLVSQDTFHVHWEDDNGAGIDHAGWKALRCETCWAMWPTDSEVVLV
jgi:hypothetical protein